MKTKTTIFCCAVSFVIIAMLLLSSCSTRKNTFPNRAFHNTTARFNVLFNGKEAMKAGEADLETKVKDNYTTLLPIYNYPSHNELGSILPHMDRVIQKSSKCIYKHSMYIRGKEYVKYIDNAYFLMGKAYFHKQDYNQAQRTFSYIENTYKVSDIKEEAKIMNARTALRQKYYSRAFDLLEEVDHSIYKKKNKKLKLQYNAAMAEYHLTAPEGEMESAVDFINEAIANRPKQQFKTRLYFIRGQLYELLNQPTEARESFMTVIKRTPPYEMEFNAHMHLATNYDGSKAAKTSILKEMNKMLEEKKNEDYKDQIYYAISEIYRIDGDTSMQKDFLIRSVAAYSNNDYQRTFSSLALADIYFDEENYMDAQNYYDTATMTMPKNYPDYDNIIKKSNVLRELTDQLKMIALQDSLQRIAKMSEGQRNQWVQRMIAAYTEKERKEAEEEAARMLALQSTAGMANVNVNANQSGKWYFYNTSLIAAGQTEFYRRWGNRKLEDNWRISNKQQISFEDMALMNNPDAAKDTVEYDEEGNPIPKRETDPKKPAYYTQDLPLTQAAMDSSNAMVVEALYNCALIYMDQLNDMKRANETLKKLIARYPNHDLALSSIYLLYLNYGKVNDQQQSDYYKNIILTQYAETDYARLISDPTYYIRLEEKNKDHERKYDIAYDYYINRNWPKTVEIANNVLLTCTDRKLSSKFAYLRAVAIGQIMGEDSLKRALSGVILNFPNTEVETLARIYLSNFEEDVNVALAQAGDTLAQQAVIKREQTKLSPFVDKPDEIHYVVIILNSSSVPMQTVKDEIANFNREFFSLEQFNLNSFFLNKNDQMITISKFKNKEVAMNYYQIMVNNPVFASRLAGKHYEIYTMSSTNYTSYYNMKDKRDLYPDFFNDHYLKEK
ncbi:MAG: tetratricopeptide repeat protein [Bacteroidales bacterium]|nr:tetratricopeptide repeat protein [Bacteroidales bacterium]